MKLGKFELDKIYLGDNSELMKEIPDESIDLVLTDPPYSTPVITAYGRKKEKNLGDLSIQEFFFNAFRIQTEQILKPNGRLFIFCDDKFYPVLFAVFYKWLNIQLIIWDKKHIKMGRPIRKRHELILYLNRESYKFNKNENNTHCPSVLQFQVESNKLIGSQKPQKLIEFLIKGFSREGDIILDPFIGSGTTAVACRKLGRHFLGFEINPEYVEIANRRLSEVQVSML